MTAAGASLPPGSRVAVVGADAAGMSAAASLRRLRGDLEVVAFEQGPYTSYSMCGIPAYVGGLLDDPEDLVARTPEQLRAGGIAVHTRTEVVGIDSAAQRLRVRDLDAGRERDEPYDALLYAAGAHPVTGDLPGVEHGHVVHTLDEGRRLREVLDARDDVEQVVVVGAGYIGLELAEALVRRGLDAVLIDRGAQVMPTLDPAMAAHVERALRDFGVDVRLSESLAGIDATAGRCTEVRTDRGRYRADAVVLAMGARPRVALAAAAGCAVGDSGALVVDERMRTTVAGIWAAGDCVESRHLVSGRPVNVQLGTHANKQGKVAALDIAADGDGPARFPGVVGTAVTTICDTEVARTGLSTAEAEAAGIAVAETTFTATARADYLPDPGRVVVRMLAEVGSGRLVGAQLVGTGNVGKRIDVAATWCQLGVPVQEAQLFDLAYAPPFGGVWDLLQVGARKLTRTLGLSPVL